MAGTNKGRDSSVLFGIFLTSLALRPQLVGIGPLYPAIAKELAISNAAVGLLGTIPLLMMGLASWLGTASSNRWSPQAALGLGVLLIAAFGCARALSSSVLFLIVTTVGVGAGIGIAGVAITAVAKTRFSDRAAEAMAITAAGIQLGAAISAGAAVYLATLLGTWRWGLLILSGWMVFPAAFWLRNVRAGTTATQPEISPKAFPYECACHRTRLRATIFFSIASITYYGVALWWGAWLSESGISSRSAGVSLSVLNLAGLFGSFLIARLAKSDLSLSLQMVIGGVAQIAGLTALILYPEAAAIWAVIIGLSSGALFALVLSMPVRSTTRASDAANYAAFMLGFGYCVSSFIPYLLGWLRDSGDLRSGLWLLVLTTVGLVVLVATPTSRSISSIG